ncbi:MAG: hypothetical protein QOD42_1718 [Sphingomonadales bacterium]|jgi:hypothetical protein|nr:hypothetical protein [Sphingomonadales bacterium]
MTAITFTSTSTTNTVKSTQTIFTNDTDKTITLRYKDGASEAVAVRASTVKISKTIQSINYGASNYYPNVSNYTIAANKTVRITKSDSGLVMSIP